ncbi:MAG: DOMON-like domain-containing protein [Holophaga sp.]|nr:DOMON-like domain-containing protein [Holophaga sp.]
MHLLPSSTPQLADLRCHPDTPCPVVRSLQARVSLLNDGILAFDFTLVGDLDQLVIPTQGTPVFTDGLWKHSCFEAFLAWEGTQAYRELNFSPSTAWAAYAFERYREGGSSDLCRDPHIVVDVQRGRLELHAITQLDGTEPVGPLCLGLSAVLEHKDGGFSYWALQHPPGCPDFHHPFAFTLRVDAPRFRD